MKKMFSFAVYVMAAMAMALAMGSCKKENQNVKTNNSGTAVSHFDPSHISDMNAYLGEFKQKMKQSQYTKDNETLSLEEAAWHLSSVANYDFANANAEFTDLRYDTLQYHVNVTNGHVALSDLNAVYASMASDIDAFYQNLDLQEKHFRFIGASVSENGQVRVGLITSYIVLDHTWYFAGDWEAALFCYEWLDDNTYYDWNTGAKQLLESLINSLEGHNYSMNNNPPVVGRVYYVYTMDTVFTWDNCIDPYGSPFFHDSRLYAALADAHADPWLEFNEMCYCIDSYLGLPFEYIESNPLLGNQRPVHWEIQCSSYKYLPSPKWYAFCHNLKVTFAQCIIANENPIQY